MAHYNKRKAAEGAIPRRRQIRQEKKALCTYINRGDYLPVGKPVRTYVVQSTSTYVVMVLFIVVTFFLPLCLDSLLVLLFLSIVVLLYIAESIFPAIDV